MLCSRCKVAFNVMQSHRSSSDLNFIWGQTKNPHKNWPTCQPFKVDHFNEYKFKFVKCYSTSNCCLYEGGQDNQLGFFPRPSCKVRGHGQGATVYQLSDL